MHESIRLIPSFKLGKGIIHILTNARKHVVLVSPYCNFLNWKEFTTAIENCIAKGLEVHLFTREDDTAYKNESINLLINNGVHVYLIKKLHAKLYMNENAAIITSLNLLYLSVRYSKEIGCFITKQSIVNHLHKDYFEDFKATGRYISYTISFTIDSDVEQLSDYFPDLIVDDK